MDSAGTLCIHLPLLQFCVFYLEPVASNPSAHAFSSFRWSSTACKASPFLSFLVVLPVVPLPFVGKVYVFEKRGKMRKIVGPSRNVSEVGRVVLHRENISYQLAVPLMPWKESCQENPALLSQRPGGIPLPMPSHLASESTVVLSERFHSNVTRSSAMILFLAVVTDSDAFGQLWWQVGCPLLPWRGWLAGTSSAAVTGTASRPGEAVKSNWNLGLGMGNRLHSVHEEELAYVAWKKDCPDEAWIMHLADTAFKTSSFQFAIDLYSVD